MADNNPFSELPQKVVATLAPAPVEEASPLPEGSVGLCLALMVTVAALGAAAAVGTGLVVEELLPDTTDPKLRLVSATLAATAGALFVDVTIGVLALAGGIGVSAALAGATTRDPFAVARRLWLPFAIWRAGVILGNIIIIPGLLLALFALFAVDPVRYGEARGSLIAGPNSRSIGPLLLLLVVWGVVVVCYQLFMVLFWPDLPTWAAFLALGAYEFLALGAWVAWCGARRR